MRVGVIADTHLGKSLYGYCLTPDIRAVMYRFLHWAIAQRVDAAVHLGDVGDRPYWSTAQQKLVLQWCNEFERRKLPLYLLAGNHDVVSKTYGATALDAVKAVRWRYVRAVDRPAVIDRMLFVPFPSPALHETSVDWAREVSVHERRRYGPQVRVAFTHLNSAEAKLGEQEHVYRGADHNVEDVLSDGFTGPIFNGHIHTPQRRGNLIMPGAATRLSYVDATSPRCFALSDGGVAKLYKLPGGVQMRSCMIDVSRWPAGGEVSSDEVIEHIGDVNGKLVKVQPIVDHQAQVDWAAVERALYAGGAVHVHVAPPAIAERERRRQRRRNDVSRADPMKLARGFTAERIKDTKERAGVIGLFQKLAEVEDGK